ncbi:MAG: PEBP family protein [archaeon GW2011_AR11]|nr:MAG: PEBP family protein [archaeon GW2011_AR11]
MRGGGNMKLSSPDFLHERMMPPALTCDGADISPELRIADVPKDAESLALIMDDPDAPVGTWDHWVVFNIPPATAVVQKGKEPAGIGGRNSWGRTGYGGPCPPSGMHRYYFRMYALSDMLPLKEGAAKKEVLKAMEGRILAQAELMGTYRRQ